MGSQLPTLHVYGALLVSLVCARGTTGFRDPRGHRLGHGDRFLDRVLCSPTVAKIFHAPYKHSHPPSKRRTTIQLSNGKGTVYREQDGLAQKDTSRWAGHNQTDCELGRVHCPARLHKASHLSIQDMGKLSASMYVKAKRLAAWPGQPSSCVSSMKCMNVMTAGLLAIGSLKAGASAEVHSGMHVKVA